ncbi:hypothetical protein OAO01_09375 [Oligoflexia bacterium]|nr:hypothetical protein [Oligoflexia bacterium]
MSVLSVCGGVLPEGVEQLGGGISDWAKQNQCLFTVVNKLDIPKLVVEFFAGFEGDIDNEEVEHQKLLKPLLAATDINYVTISNDEFSEMLDPNGNLDFYSFLKDKVEHSVREPVQMSHE